MLKEAIQEAASKFSDAVMEAVQAHLKDVVGTALASALDDDGGSAEPVRPRGRPAAPKGAKKATRKASPKTKASGRLARRSPEEIAAAVGKVVSVLKKNPAGLRAEDIRAATGLSPKELPRVLKQGVADKAFKITGGQKRSTTYGLKGGSASAKPKKAARKAAKASGKGKAPKAKKAARKPTKAKKAASKAAPKAKAKAKAKALNGAAETQATA